VVEQPSARCPTGPAGISFRDSIPPSSHVGHEDSEETDQSVPSQLVAGTDWSGPQRTAQLLGAWPPPNASDIPPSSPSPLPGPADNIEASRARSTRGPLARPALQNCLPASDGLPTPSLIVVDNRGTAIKAARFNAPAAPAWRSCILAPTSSRPAWGLTNGPWWRRVRRPRPQRQAALVGAGLCPGPRISAAGGPALPSTLRAGVRCQLPPGRSPC